MASRIFMPKLGMSMEEGTIDSWLKAEGDSVEAGDPLVIIETDKVNMEVEALDSGVLLKITRGPGQTVPVTRTIGWIGEAGEEIPDQDPDLEDADDPALKEDDEEQDLAPAQAAASAPLKSPTGKIAATPAARRLAKEKGISLASATPTGYSGEIKARDVEALGDIRVSPVARKMALDLDLDLTTLTGTGPGGKIMEVDVTAHVRASAAGETPAASAPTAETFSQPLSRMRHTIGKRMLASHLAIPPVTQVAKANVTELVEIRQKYNQAHGVKISLNDILLKVTALALADHRVMNTTLVDDQLIQHGPVNLGMAVALDEGLIVPVIHNADQLSLSRISAKAKELAAKAREGRLVPDECTGGTFTLSNMGGFGIYHFTPIINPPEIGILGAGAIEEKLALVEGQVKVTKIMGLSLTFDHRAIDGAQAAIFQSKIRDYLEDPYSLMTFM